MAVKYYSDLFEIDDSYRKNKYYQLLMNSLKSDLNKWTEKVSDSKTIYISPDYSGSNFIIECRTYGNFAYIKHSNPPLKDHPAELISDDFSSELKSELKKLRETIFTPDIYEIEKLIGNQFNRKEKLEFLEIEQLKEMIEDTYQDWLEDKSLINAKLIAKLIYSYRKKEEINNSWLEKFKDCDLIMQELNILKGK